MTDLTIGARVTMSELEAFRDHARRLASADHHDECPSRRPSRGHPFRAEHCGNKSPHAPHEHRPLRDCPGVCPGCMPEPERRLWAALADEVDHYLAGGDADDEPLFDDLGDA